MAVFERSKNARTFYGTADDTKPTVNVPAGSRFVEFAEAPEGVGGPAVSSGNVFIWTGEAWALLWSWEGSVPNV